jgi:hypothetical protein
MVLLYYFHYAMDKRLSFESLEELSDKDTVIPPMIQSTTVYHFLRRWDMHSSHQIGPRKLNIALTQLRCIASFLNYDLFKVNIVSDPSCLCGAKSWRLASLLLWLFPLCKYEIYIVHNLSWLPNDCAIDLKLLTSGNPILSNEQNEIFLSTCLNI